MRTNQNPTPREMSVGRWIREGEAILSELERIREDVCSQRDLSEIRGEYTNVLTHATEIFWAFDRTMHIAKVQEDREEELEDLFDEIMEEQEACIRLYKARERAERRRQRG